MDYIIDDTMFAPDGVLARILAMSDEEKEAYIAQLEEELKHDNVECPTKNGASFN